jgi:hypothetical protein
MKRIKLAFISGCLIRNQDNDAQDLLTFPLISSRVSMVSGAILLLLLLLLFYAMAMRFIELSTFRYIRFLSRTRRTLRPGLPYSYGRISSSKPRSLAKNRAGQCPAGADIARIPHLRSSRTRTCHTYGTC